MAESISAKIKQPVNNGNPVLLPLFVCNLKQWIMAAHPMIRKFIEHGS